MATSKQFDWGKHIELMEENIKLKKDIKDLKFTNIILRDTLLLFFDKFEKWEGMRCLKHDKAELDCWYDCEECCEEAQEWAEANGFTQCVSPHKQEEGTDKGKWVNINCYRWIRYGNDEETK